MWQPSSGRRVVFVCDVGPSIGVGHVMRCLALAEELDARGHAVCFVADLLSVPFARSEVERRGFPWSRMPVTDGLVRVVESLRPEIIVVDSYLTPRPIYTALRTLAPLVALVDGDVDGVDGDVLLDANLGAETDSWDVPAHSTRLAGLDYCLIRREIRESRGRSRAPESQETPRIFAFFGGTDAFSLAPVVVEAASRTGAPFEMRVVTARPDMAEAVGDVPLASGQRVERLSTSSAVADEVINADAVVAAAGGSLWELLCLGAACAVVCVAENQVRAYSRVERSGLASGLGRREDLSVPGSKGEARLAALLRDPMRRRMLKNQARDAVDGLGCARVARVMEDLSSAR